MKLTTLVNEYKRLIEKGETIEAINRFYDDD
jgi:hypothetical protein